MRIKPQPPTGVTDVCFGSSVIIGPAIPDTRPYVDIQEVRVHPETFQLGLDIVYRDGQTAHIDFSVGRTRAVADVTVGYNTSDNIPFATFRSMWVEDGNADVDHVQNLEGQFQILSGWTTLKGPWWFFHRNVDSQHNRSAPDIRVVVDTPAVFRVERPTGNVFADGAYFGQSFYSGSADVAEWVPVSEPVEPGDVLELDPDNPGQYRKARGPCSDLVAGVVSSDPGVILGSEPQIPDSGLPTPDRALLALLGIVPVKATNEGGPIQPGDLLVTSSTPGHAMRWDPDDGSPCNLVGKALEPLAEESGIILALLTAH